MAPRLPKSIRARTASLACVLLSAAVAACTKQPVTGDASATQADAHAWNVYDGDVLILNVSDVPGPILSTAMPPPGTAPVKHPFLSASARSARHEHQLHDTLSASQNLADFLNRLRAAGFKVVPITAPATAVPASGPPALAFTVVENIEMVPYCIPYPSSYMKEDTSQRWEHGRKMFVARKPTAGVAPSRLDLAGTCGSRSLKELFEADRQAVEAEVGASAVTVRKLQDDSYALSWRAGDRIHYGKVWSARNDAGCFVKAKLEYDERERTTFDAIIARVTSASPTCPAASEPSLPSQP